MTSGWLQHAACTPELLARKIAADRALPLAEALTSAIFAPFGYATVAIRPRGAIERAPFVSSVTNEAPDGLAYRIMRHEDLGLDHHARYWYRIVPVFKDGSRGEPSAPFGGVTRGDESH